MGKRSKARSTASEELSVDSNTNKKIKFEDNDDETNDESTVPSKKKTSQTKNEKKAQKSNKIIFEDDEPVEVESTSKTEDVSNKPKKNKPKETSESLENEEDVKDEDIDKFCDEINEEDNEQYENWVKLIEAKLNANKKKNK